MKISFDYDNTLEHKIVQDKTKILIHYGYNVCIVTTRYEDTTKYSFNATHDDLFEIANKLGITEIHFTNYEWKYTVIDNWNIDFHIDDNYRDEIIPMNKFCKCKGILYSYSNPNWFDELLKKMEDKICL